MKRWKTLGPDDGPALGALLARWLDVVDEAPTSAGEVDHLLEKAAAD